MDDNERQEVITVLGPIDPAEMGITHTHEHLLIDAMDHYGGYDFVNDDEEMAVEEMQNFKRLGGRTICDVTLDEIGRNPEAPGAHRKGCRNQHRDGMWLVPRVRLSARGTGKDKQ